MKLGIVIQARLGSTRFPKKMLAELTNGISVFEYIISKLRPLQGDYELVLATTDNTIDDELVDLAIGLGLAVFRGSEKNVLSRFVDAMDQHGFTHAVRVCADNPFLDISLLNQLIQFVETKQTLDYASFKLSDDTPVILTHYGFFAEVVSLSALQQVLQSTENNFYLEHVTNYLYGNSNQFEVDWLPVPKFIEDQRDVRLTLDTPDDMVNIKAVIELAKTEGEFVKTSEIFDLIAKEKELLGSMKNQIRENKK